MSETPLPPAAPTPPPAAPSAANANGSLGFGIALAWACLIGGYIIVGVFASVIFSLLNGVNSDLGPWLAALIALLPWIAMIFLIVHFSKLGQNRTALGVGVGIGSIIGVLLLLVAACFGLLSNANFH